MNIYLISEKPDHSSCLPKEILFKRVKIWEKSLNGLSLIVDRTMEDDNLSLEYWFPWLKEIQDYQWLLGY